MPFLTVLYVDDDDIEVGEVRQLVDSLQQRGYYVRLANPKELDIHNPEKYLPGLDLAILDWNLVEGDDDNKTTDFWGKYFTQNAVPVIVYTGDDQFSEVEGKVAEKDWGKLSKVVKKDPDQDAAGLIEDYLQKTGDLTMRVGLVWKPAVWAAMHATLKSLREVNPDSFRMLARSSLKDALHVGEAITELFQEVFVSSMSLDVSEVRKVVGEVLDIQVTGDAEEPQGNLPEVAEGHYAHVVEILQLLMYDTSDKVRTDTGDILRFQNGDYGVVVTPRCDLARAKESDPVTYIGAHRLLDHIGGWEPGSAKDFVQNTWQVPDSRPGYFVLYDVPLKDQLLERTGPDEPIVEENEQQPATGQVAEHQPDPKVGNETEAASEELGEQAVAQFHGEQGERKKPVPIDLVLDFALVNTLTVGDIAIQRVARLRSPYLDSLVYGYVRHLLRYGMPTFPYKSANKKAPAQKVAGFLAEEKVKKLLGMPR